MFSSKLTLLSNLFWRPLFLFGGLCLLEIWAIVWLNEGLFIYALDDTYIHLAMAENIARWHYGINLETYVAASSSILWPFLLALFQGWEYAPLLINILSGGAIVWLYHHFSNRYLFPAL